MMAEVNITSDFARFITQKLNITQRNIPEPGQWAGAGYTIGALALRLNLLDLTQIDHILEAQKSENALFGQLAVQLGYISQSQVNRLVDLQKLHQSLELGELLVISGRLTLSELLVLLQDFHS